MFASFKSIICTIYRLKTVYFKKLLFEDSCKQSKIDEGLPTRLKVSIDRTFKRATSNFSLPLTSADWTGKMS